VIKTSVVIFVIGALLLPVALLGQDWVPELPNGGPATIVLHIVDTYGNPVKYRVESFHDVRKPNVDLARKFKGLTFREAVRWKTYEFRLVPAPQDKVFLPFKERVFVGEPLTFAVFAVRESVFVPDSSEPWPVTKLILKSAPRSGGPIWVAVRPAFLPLIDDTGTETETVGQDGTVTLHGLHGGRYIVTVCQDGRTPRLALVDLPVLGPQNPIEVRLK
jgi:hypothetical protein